MSFGDQIDDLSNFGVDRDHDGQVDAFSFDTDGNGQDDTTVLLDPSTGDYAVHSVDETDGSTVTLLYDSSGSVISAAFGDPSGAITEVTGPDVVGFLTEFGELTGTDVPFESPTEPPVDSTYEPLPDQPDDIFITQVPIDPTADDYISVDDVTGSPGYEDWAEANPDTVIGDVSDADFWFKQSTGYTCAPSAATQIVEDFTGADLGDESEVADWAKANGLLDEDGMYPNDLVTTLNHFGVPSTLKEDQDWDDIAGYLEEGRSVVMVVDAGDYWRPGNDHDRVENADDDVTDHVVRIVGIDTERNVAILSDSGAPYGQLLEVPLDTMEEAWNDVSSPASADNAAERNHFLIVSDNPDPTGEDTSGSPLTDFVTPENRGDGDVNGLYDFDGAPSAAETGTSPLTDFRPAASGLDTAGTTEDGGWVGKAFANPAGWVLIPVTLAASRIFATRK